MSLDLVIFDVDGLMLDTERIWQEVWRDVARDYVLEDVGASLFMKVVGYSGDTVREILQKELQGHCTPDEFLQTARKEGLERLKTQLKVKPGVYDILSFLKQKKIKTAVATSTSRLLTEERLKRVGLYDEFSCICCGDEVRNKKPSPDIYLEVLRKTGINNQRALVFEDSKVGITAAYRANIPCIMVPDLKEPEPEQIKMVKQVLPSLKLAVPIIEKMIEGRLNKNLKEMCLVDQAFIKDSDQTVAQYLGNGKVLEMVRFEVGEGMEKREENFAEEVAAQMRG